jgi:hypothetical protein
MKVGIKIASSGPSATCNIGFSKLSDKKLNLSAHICYCILMLGGCVEEKYLRDVCISFHKFKSSSSPGKKNLNK